MPKPSSRKDLNQLAASIVTAATSDTPSKPITGKQKNPAAVALGRLGGLKGGKARAEKLSKNERIKIAKQAGFFEIDPSRLTYPPINVGVEPKPTMTKEEKHDEPSPELHPFIEGLLKTLPKPEAQWPITGRMKWLQAACNIFDLIYQSDKDEAEVSVEIKKSILEKTQANKYV